MQGPTVDHSYMSVSRQALLQWVNDLLQLNYTKLDQLGTGAAYCQIMDSIYGDVPMARVKFDSTQQYDYQTNFKILQAVFTKNRINRSFDSQKLMKCKLQDNLEFVQWLYKFWEDNAPKVEYDPLARRKAAPSAPSRVSMAPSPAAGRASRSQGRVSTVASRRSPVPATSAAATARTTSRTQASRASTRTSLSHLQPALTPHGKRGPDPRIVELESQVEELESTINVVARERTLYYGKLLEIEELLQARLNLLYAQKGDSLNDDEPQVELVRTIQSILYASAEGFDAPYRPEDEPF